MKGGTVEKDKNPKEKKTMVKPFLHLKINLSLVSAEVFCW